MVQMKKYYFWQGYFYKILEIYYHFLLLFQTNSHSRWFFQNDQKNQRALLSFFVVFFFNQLEGVFIKKWAEQRSGTINIFIKKARKNRKLRGAGLFKKKVQIVC